MKISVKQVNANKETKYQISVNGEHKYTSVGSRVTSMKRLDLLNNEGVSQLYTKYQPTKSVLQPVSSIIGTIIIVFGGRLFGLNEAVIMMAIFAFQWFLFKIINKKKGKHKLTMILDINDNQIGEFYSSQTYERARKYMVFNGKEFNFDYYGFGKEYGFFIFDGEKKIGASVKNYLYENNNDAYDIFVFKGYEEYEQMFILFAVLYDNYYEAKRNEVAVGKQKQYSYTFGGSQSKEEKEQDRNWLKDNMENF